MTIIFIEEAAAAAAAAAAAEQQQQCVCVCGVYVCVGGVKWQKMLLFSLYGL